MAEPQMDMPAPVDENTPLVPPAVPEEVVIPEMTAPASTATQRTAAKTAEEEPAAKKPAKAHRRKSMMEQGMDAFNESPAGKKVHALLKKAVPVLKKGTEICMKVYPYVKQGYEKAVEIHKAVEPYNLAQYYNIVCGLVLIFFGGHFVTTIATVEAIRLCGYERSKKAFTILYKNAMVAKEANDKDDTKDDDNDGIADVEQITDDQLVTRKMLLVFKIVNPDELSEALTCVYAAWVAVMATLRLKFARAITLGCNIGGYISKPLKKKVTPVLKQALAPEYHRWIPVVIDYLCKSFGITLAWVLVRIINAFNAACRGAHMLVQGIDEVAKKNGLDWLSEGQLDDMLAWSLAAIGLYMQLTSMFYLPWYLAIPLLPFTILESVLTNVVGTTSA